MARASAYAEFIERLQCGLFLYKFQSITRDPKLNIQMFAPDGKYMTMQELVENGEWMDHIIRTYDGGLTREKLAKQCKVYAYTQEDKIWTIPFYSLFEDKYVYLPAGFVEHIYSANGCCAGNTREEAWVHAFSEMMERHCTIAMLTGKKAAPPIPEEVIRRLPTAASILDAVRRTGKYDIQLFDFSIHPALPAVATRIIDKKTHGYFVDVSADPILEIAIDRTLTESFQGRKLKAFGLKHNGGTIEETKGFPVAHNVHNQIEHGYGIFSANFFAEETCDRPCTQFVDHRGKNNTQLLESVLEIYRQMGRPVYVRNCSFLGFPSYQFVIPGFSEARGFRLIEPVQEYALGDAVQPVFRDMESAAPADLTMMLAFYKKVSTAFSRRDNFAGLAGLPVDNECGRLLTAVTLSGAAYRLGNYAQAKTYIKPMVESKTLDEDTKEYLTCVCRYLGLKEAGIEDEKVRLILAKYCRKEYADRLYACLDAEKNPYDAYLMKCGRIPCVQCRYAANCSYERSKQIIGLAGARYSAFVQGQGKETFGM